MATLRRLTDILSGGLNREVSANLSNVAISLYKKTNTKESFADATKALGFSGELARSVYIFINDNIGNLSDETSQCHSQVSRPKWTRVSRDKENGQGISTPKRKVSALQLDDIDSTEDGLMPSSKVGVISQEELDDLPEVSSKKVTFKKIRKEDAKRIKGSDKREQTPSSLPNPLLREDGALHDQKDHHAGKNEVKNLSCSNNHDQSSSSVAPNVPNEVSNELFETHEDIENDREWYMLEDSTTATVDQYEDLDAEYRVPRTCKSQSSFTSRTGGGFSSEGRYVDYDHDQHQQLGRITIIPHFLVPPFLRGSEQHLSLQLDSSRTGRLLGPSVNPIKNPDSELARSAREGSFVIKDRKEKAERAKQVKDRIISDNENVKTEAPPQHDTDQSVYSYEDIQKQRRSLPAYQVKAELMQVILENQIVIVIGETGSGKTTQLTQFLFEEGFTKNLQQDGSRLLVACTQPRRVAAMSVAKRVSEEMGTKLGEEVGYTIRFEDKTSPSKTRIKYMTEGILLREILEDPMLEQYSCVIMDEAHERSLNTDVLLGLFRNLLRRRRDLKLIVTSATMNADRFARYFCDAPQFFIPGRTFPVEVFYSKSRCLDYVETAVKQVMTIHLANKVGDGDILVFMTGQEDIEVTCELIKEKLSMLEDPPPLDILPIYSTLPADVQKKIFAKTSSSKRKVVIATNIAETSLTVDGIRYVVDCGLVKMKLFNPKLGMDALQVVPVSLANAQQRSGRAGRTGPGLAYRLFTESAAQSDQMFEQPIPEIQRTNLSAVMLLLKSLKVQDVSKFPFLDAPPPDLLACSLYDLWAMGALSHSGSLTELGSKLTDFPMVPTLAKLIILSCSEDFHCSEDIITIVSMLSVPNIFHRPKERAQEADNMRERFLIAESDHLTLLNVYTQWEQRSRAKGMSSSKFLAWSSKHFLNHKSLIRARDVRTQLLAIVRKLQYPVWKAKTDTDIRRCICAVYFHQSASLVKMSSGRGQAEYANIRQPYIKMYLHPTSALATGTDLSPQYVVYDELVLTKKEYMQCVTSVEPEWLLKYGQVFFGVSSSMKDKLKKDRGITVIDSKDLEIEMNSVANEISQQTIQAPKVNKFKARRNF